MADELRAGTIDTLPERPDIQNEPGPPVNGPIDWGFGAISNLVHRRDRGGSTPEAAAAIAAGPPINRDTTQSPASGSPSPPLQPQQGAPPAPNQDPFKPKPGILGNGVIEGTPQAGAPAATPETYAQAVAKKLTAPPQPQQQPQAPINNLIYALRHTNPNTAYSRIPLPPGFKGFKGF